jgi:hypothetical protein
MGDLEQKDGSHNRGKYTPEKNSIMALFRDLFRRGAGSGKNIRIPDKKISVLVLDGYRRQLFIFSRKPNFFVSQLYYSYPWMHGAH